MRDTRGFSIATLTRNALGQFERLAGHAEALRAPLPPLGVPRDHQLQTIAAGGEDIGWSGIGLTIAKNAGPSR